MYQWLNLGIATVTNLGAAYLFVVMFHWVWRLKGVETPFRPWIFSVGLAKFALWFWTFMNILNIVWMKEDQPLITLLPRVFFLIVVLIQIRVTTLYPVFQPEPDADWRFVLIVEDSTLYARMYRKFLETAGINAEFAINGSDALTFIEHEKPSLLIVDLGLPDMNGVELVRRAREIGYKGAVVAISGSGELIDSDKLKPAEFSEVFTKPISRLDLIGVVQKWV